MKAFAVILIILLLVAVVAVGIFFFSAKIDVRFVSCMGAENRCGYLLTGSESDRCIGGRNLTWAFTAKLGNLPAHVNRKAQASGNL